MTVPSKHHADKDHPRPGQRLQIGAIATELGISMQDMADATTIGKTSVFRVLCNEWPARTSRDEIEQALRNLFAARGASEEQVASLFKAHIVNRHSPRGKDALAAAAALAPQPDPAAPRLRTEKEITEVLLAKQTLTPEARKAFELFTNPFDGEVESADQMYTNGEIRFVREACWQAAINARFVGMTGESGSGKTTLLADLKERIATDHKPIHVIEPSVLGMDDSASHGAKLKAADILAAIVLSLNPAEKVAQTMEKRTRQVERMLADSTTAGNSHLLLIEEAHSLPIVTLKHLKRLHERMRLNGRKPMLGILLLGQPELRAKLDDRRHDVREVVQRIEMVELKPLGHDLKHYLAFRAKQAGRELGALMDDGAVEQIRERLTVLRPGVRNTEISLLYPLAVNNTVTACLNHAAEHGIPLVTKDVVRAI